MWKRLRKSLHFNEAVCIKTIARREILLGHVPLYLLQMNIDEYVDFSLKITCVDLGIEINYWYWYHQTNIALLISLNLWNVNLLIWISKSMKQKINFYIKCSLHGNSIIHKHTVLLNCLCLFKHILVSAKTAKEQCKNNASIWSCVVLLFRR